MAIGLWISLLASNQIVAAICCFCGVMLPLLAGYAGTLLPPACEPLVAYVSTHFHVMDFARGSIDSRPVVLYVSGTALMLFMAVRQLESRRWRS
jgi:ABC-2 type transport system permease protein